MKKVGNTHHWAKQEYHGWNTEFMPISKTSHTNLTFSYYSHDPLQCRDRLSKHLQS